MRIKVSEFRKVVFVVMTVFVSTITPIYCQEIRVDGSTTSSKNCQLISPKFAKQHTTSESLLSVKMFPNPVKENVLHVILTIPKYELSGRKEIKIYNISGELVISVDDIPEDASERFAQGDIDVSSLANGIYVYMVKVRIFTCGDGGLPSHTTNYFPSLPLQEYYPPLIIEERKYGKIAVLR